MHSSVGFKTALVFSSFVALAAACDDDEARRLRANLDAAVGSLDASQNADVLAFQAPDGSPDVAVDAASHTPDAFGKDAGGEDAFGVPLVDAGDGCVLVPYQAQSAAQAGLPVLGLALWLRADQGVYTTSTKAVCGWVDHSGANRIFAPGTTAGRPQHASDGIKGQAGIRFTGSGKALSVAGVLGIAAQSARTFIVVQKLLALAARSQPVWQGQGGTPGTYVGIDTNTFQTTGQREGVYVTNNAYDSSAATTVEPRLHMFSVGAMTVASPVLPALTYRIDGKALTLARTPGGLGNTNFENFAGANFTAVGSSQSASDFVIAEVLIYDHALSAEEQSTVQSALAARYQIALTNP